MNKHITLCPGCGLRTDAVITGIDEKYNTSYACLKLYWELSAYTLSLRNDFFIHQYVVDTYAAQHVNAQTKPIKVCFALIGLYLAIEHKYTVRQVQLAHMLLAEKSKTWPTLSLPNKKTLFTVQDVLGVIESGKNTKIEEWMRSVWDIWEPEHNSIAKLVDQYMDPSEEYVL